MSATHTGVGELLRGLPEIGAHIEQASAATALDGVADERFDLVVIDREPTRDAEAVLDALRGRDGASTPALIIAAGSDARERTALLAAGALDVLRSPVDPVELERKVRTCLELSRLRSEVDGRGAMDATRNREIEGRLANSQKMEALAILAGGIAHDFNNILAVILSFAGFASEGLSTSDRRYADLNEVIKAANRAARLTRQLLSVTSQQPTQVDPTDLNQKVTDLNSAIRRAAGESVRVNVVLAPRPAVVEIDPVQFDQVLLNLVVNAREAMPHGGSLEIRLEVDAESSLVRLLVADSGRGMDSDTQRRVFEPFFTTKEKGNGAGLGLTACFSIIDAAGGTISVKSTPGRGSTFCVELPFSTAAASRLPAPARAELLGNGENVLLVEDEPTLLGALVRVFESAGYHVRAAANGAEAKRAIDELGPTLDAVVSDVVMPEVGGYEVAAYATQVAPNAVVLLTSGYLDGARSDGPFPILWKPIPPRDIARAVASALAERADDGAARAAAAARKTPASTTAFVAAPSGQVVLVVEDDEAAQQALSRLLKSAGFIPRVAGTIVAARAALDVTPEPDVVLCDLSLPDGSGTELLELLQKTRPGLCGRVLVLTGSIAHATSQLQVAGVNFPVVSKLTPPAQLLDLLAASRGPSLPAEAREPAKPSGREPDHDDDRARELDYGRPAARSPRGLSESVLIVDSDGALARATVRILGSTQFELVLASTAEEARNAAQRGKFAAVVLDLALADDDGAVLLEQLRKMQPDLGAVAITNNLGSRTRAAALRADTTDCLTRPFSAEELRAAVRRVIDASRAAHIRRQLLASRHGGDDFLANLPETTRAFDRALKTVSLSYQPIVRAADDFVFGYEALLRCADSAFASPARLLAAAQVLGRTHDLGHRVREAVAATLTEHAQRDDVIFVNVDPVELNDDLLAAPGDPLLPFARRIVLEISERAAVLSMGTSFEQRLARLRECGYRLALDDLGEGYAGLSTLASIRPDIAKIDMSLVRRIQHSPLKRDIIGSVLRMARSAGIVVAAEGVESAEECGVLAELGCDLLQGYFFARPGPAFPVPQRAVEASAVLQGP